MSGEVNTSIRFNDGEIINRIIDTSDIHSLFMSRAFFERDKEAIKDLIKELSVESWTESCDVVAPLGYGLIVVDFLSDTILDMQDHYSIGRLNLGGYRFKFIEKSSEFDQYERHQKSTLKLIVELFLEKRVLELESQNMVNDDIIYLSIDKKLNDFESICRYLNDINKRNFVNLYYDTRCLIKSIEYPNYSDFMSYLSLINYPLDDKAISIFNVFIKENT